MNYSDPDRKAGDPWRALLDILPKKRRRAAPGDPGALGVIAAALVAMETVVGLVIDVDFAFRRFFLISSTMSMVMCASLRPKCIWVGHFGFSSAKRAMPPP
jgi:hypothetical protein